MDDKNVPVLHCPTCYSSKFKTSKPRPEDRLQLLTFKHPVRCRKCNARMFAGRAYVKWLRKQEELDAAAKAASTSSLPSAEGVAE